MRGAGPGLRAGLPRAVGTEIRGCGGWRGARPEVRGSKGVSTGQATDAGCWLSRTPAWEGGAAAGPPGVRAPGTAARVMGWPAAAAAAALVEAVCRDGAGCGTGALDWRRALPSGQSHLQSLEARGAVCRVSYPGGSPGGPTPKEPETRVRLLLGKPRLPRGKVTWSHS